ncbi:MAG: DUF3095 family protein [Pseudomonadales bacterium]|nr:DUF3095 family protein [Pseudomonadales bacterium]
MSDSESGFYHQLIPLKHFEDFAESSNFKPLPQDWVIFITDIENSTSAIANGLYKEVNLIGAASITLTMQALGLQEIPFVFGGDGASICVHQDRADVVSEELARLASLASTNFGLTLRVARIPVKKIMDAGKQVLVSKLEITRGKFIALFHGGGLAMADKLAKENIEQFKVQPSSESIESLQGLSCRWSPMPSKKGVIVSLLVSARQDSEMAVYGEFLQRMRDILEGDIASANPVHLDSKNYKTFARALKEESAYHLHKFNYSFLKRVLGIVISVLIFRFGINPIAPFFDGAKYKNSISEHSDYRKFDDVLRLIMDCSEQQYQELQTCLDAAYRKGQIYYGLFASKEALMTCFVESSDQGGHLHFVDGGDGGLTMASRQLKLQLGGG